MADYSFNPQFANLSGLQPLPAIDVTRGANLQFRPLDKIEIQSSRPELVTEGIAGAISNIAKGALGGITARYEKKEEEEKEKRKFAHELMLYGVKEQSSNADFYAKQEAEFISENSGKPGFAQKLARFRKAYSGFSDRVPETKVETEPSDFETVEPPLPENQPELPVDFVTTSGDFPEERPGVFSWKQSPRTPQETQALSVISVSTAASGATGPALEKLPPPQVATTQPKTIAGVDYTEYDQPLTPPNKFETDADAQNFAARLNKQLKDINPDWKYQVNNLGKEDEWKTLIPVSVRKDRLDKEQAIKKEAVEGSREEKKATIEEKKATIEQEKLDIAKAKEAREVTKEEREAKKAEQEMQIRQQKVKDENKTLSDHVETAATSLRELDDIISTIEKNPWSVGRMSALYAKMPIDTDAAKVRAKLETVGSTVAINALTAMRQSSPTGAAVGNATDKDMAMFKATEGSFDPDNLKSEDILPVLREIKRKRQKIYNDASEVLKANNPEYNPPEIKYPKKEKVTQTEKVSVISPDGKVGKIPKSQLDEALSKGYKPQ